MSKNRSYRLLCPISRALDKVGDRWSLLILRDLHAGPARYIDIQKSFPRLASNLLTTRLEQLQASGLIVKRLIEYGTTVYELTKRGDATAPLLFELSALGSHWPPIEDIQRPDNLRALVVTLKEMLRRVLVATDKDLSLEFIVDDEHFAITVNDGKADVRYKKNPDAKIAIATNCEALIKVGDGNLALDEFEKKHIEIRRGSNSNVKQFLDLMSRASMRQI